MHLKKSNQESVSIVLLVFNARMYGVLWCFYRSWQHAVRTVIFYSSNTDTPTNAFVKKKFWSDITANVGISAWNKYQVDKEFKSYGMKKMFFSISGVWGNNLPFIFWVPPKIVG